MLSLRLPERSALTSARRQMQGIEPVDGRGYTGGMPAVRLAQVA